MSAEPVKFAYWLPDVSGGLVTSTIEQRTDRGYEYDRELAVLAENNGFEYALGQVQIWTEDHTELAGDFYRLRDFSPGTSPTAGTSTGSPSRSPTYTVRQPKSAAPHRGRP